MSTTDNTLPRWADIILIPIINIALALLVSGLIILAIGEDPIEAVKILLVGAFGYDEALGYTLYYTTNFIFTGLAVAIAFHAGLFNIGGEGQAYIGGLGVGLVMQIMGPILPFYLLMILGIAAAALFGAAWAYVPAYLQVYRGSHIVITTIMFNFIASALMVYLMVNVLIAPGSMAPQSVIFADSSHLPFVHEIMQMFGYEMVHTPLNISFFWALICCVLLWVYLWHSRWGYELRTVGFNEKAAAYAGINTKRVVIITMCISGALAGFVGINEIQGVHHRLLLNFTAGYGFTGIAVSLMGRNHPVGVVLASLLFGILYQGGAELAFEMPKITREMVVTIQGLVILFSGALAYMTRPWLEKIFSLFNRPNNSTVQEA